jgi:general secretion pathway protein H
MRHRPRQHGFTLLEIMMVLGIMAVIATLVTVNVVGRLESVEASATARKIAAALRHTRLTAIRSREPQVLAFDLEARSFTAPGRPPETLPESVTLKLFTATAEVRSEKAAGIRFFPDGGSTGGRVSIAVGEREWQVRVGWLTGDIDVKDSARERLE